MNFIFIIFIYELSICIAEITDFCQLDCGVMHTVCILQPCPIKKWCGSEAEIIPLTNEEKDIVVVMHNDYRSNVARGLLEKRTIGNMQIISYDSELAFVAQCWANSCKLVHDKCRSTSTYDMVGQNIMFTDVIEKEKNTTALRSTMKHWYNQGAKVKISSLLNYHPEDNFGTTHFIQMIWASVRYIGCGRTYRQNGFVIVCNYAPVNTRHKFRAVEFGKLCDLCRDRKCNESSGLCGEKREIEDDKWIPPFKLAAIKYTKNFKINFVCIISIILLN